jgi:hypothetical protein
MASTYLTRTMSSNSNQRTFTWSFWLKRSGLSSTQYFAGVGGGGAYASAIYFDSNDQLETWNYFNSSYAGRYKTNRKFRDTNAWYHIMLAVDTTLATAGDRIKIYVNGVQETSFATSDNPNQNQTWEFNSASVHEIGRNASHSFNGSMSHVIFVDGTQLTPSTFGSTDSTTGEWKINTSPSPTWGTNGFWLLKDGNVITDSSTNSNDFTVGAGTLTKTEDCPSNVFATMNPLYPFDNNVTYSNGNTSLTGTGSTWQGSIASLGFSSGKYYYEAKFTSSSNDNWYIGFGGLDDAFSSVPYRNGVRFYNNDGGEIYVGDTGTNGASTNDYGTFGNGDIIGIALDYDNETISVYKNGSAIVTNYDYGSQTYSSTIKNGKTIAPSLATYGTGSIAFNFGNGYFGTTAVSSAGTNASGNGIFEYDVPTGYTALSTKGLNL